MRQSKNLPEAPIQKFTRFHNPEYKKKCTIYIGTLLSLRNLVGRKKKNIGVQEETALNPTQGQLNLYRPSPVHLGFYLGLILI